ncbi:HigA family addiction module antitoxin [Parvularcula marina]|uniref:Addiction module antidote protein, HigA family n=1 Tax=Parvularcula marina TaxID=2292771 RepID=A0A371RFQ9_9PROT|nr:HigA family addiction module antitoxin [Parvularcula marina]RFB04275.1 addiction module antidote protein, HigA family [Parvularcula marina]
MNQNNPHPGPYIRANIIPQEVTVAAAAKLLGIGRPALQNLVSEKASLSPDLATRLEKAFGADAKSLLKMQAEHDASKVTPNAIEVIGYCPRFIEIKSSHLHQWAGLHDPIGARTRFPVLLRHLIHSTARGLSYSDFPGDDDGERKGPDGTLHCTDGNDKVPTGWSTWEFGCGGNPQDKANEDFRNKTKQAATNEKYRLSTTFIFVTPRAWPGAKAWAETKRAEGQWKDVRAYDSSDLAQWCAASPVAQAWIAQEIGLDPLGATTLEKAYERWSFVCTPPLNQKLFDQHAVIHENRFHEWIETKDAGILSVVADSIQEALAFLHVCFERYQTSTGIISPPLIIERENALTRFIQHVDGIIPVITDRDIERNIDPDLRKYKRKAIFVYGRGDAPSSENVIRLEQLGFDDFRSALESMGFGDDDVAKLDRESGRHLTVLRRRLAESETIRRPEWSQTTFSRDIVPLLICGAWDSRNEFDQWVVEELTGKKISQVELQVRQLANLDDPPLWIAGGVRGIVSRIDCLYALKDQIDGADIEKFYQYAAFVLEEKDPSIELPDEDRPFAALYGKTRQISAVLRKSMAEMLVLLSVHGDVLFREQTGVSCAAKGAQLVSDLLTPLSVDTLKSHGNDLALYAETDPTTFLSIIADDIFEGPGETRKLIVPANGAMFGGVPRTGLMSALQVTAWFERTFHQTVEILCELATIPLEDNVSPKPITVLKDIFSDWMPQTSVSVEGRIAAASSLCSKFPEVMWRVMLSMIDTRRTQSGARKPIWRSDAYGMGRPLSGERLKERQEFMNFVVTSVLGWNKHTEDSIIRLVRKVPMIHTTHHSDIYEAVRRWSADASLGELARVREVVRTSCLGRRAFQLAGSEAMQPAHQLYDDLEPNDVLYKCLWLFENSWVAENGRDFEDENFDYKFHERWVENNRTEAIEAIVSERGIGGVVDLSRMKVDQFVIGSIAARKVLSHEQISEIIKSTIEEQGSDGGYRFTNLIAGLIATRTPDELQSILASLSSPDSQTNLLIWSPFKTEIWDLVDAQSSKIRAAYWEQVHPHGMPGDDISELNRGTSSLIGANRPRAAFNYAQYYAKKLDPDLLVELLEKLNSKSEDKSGEYLLDPYWLKEALQHLNTCGLSDRSKLAMLEWQFVGAFKYDDEFEAPNLLSELERSPNLFIDLVCMVYRRDDGEQDPERLQTASKDDATARAEHAYAALKILKTVPFSTRADLSTEEKIIALTEWCEAVLTGTSELGRREVGQSALGELLAHAQMDEDGAWPSEPARSAFEQSYTSKIAQGFSIGKFNSVGAHFRGEGGAFERERRDELLGWANKIKYTHPRLFETLVTMADDYNRMAENADTDRLIRKRIGY